MIYLTLDDALFIHSEQIRLFGGAAGVRDLGLVEASLLRPQTGYYGDLIEEAAALWESLATNHGFVDGNKRVSFACTDVFLALNGHRIEAADEAVVDFIYGRLDAGTLDKSAIDAWLRDHVVPHQSEAES